MIVVYLSNRYIRVVEGDAAKDKIHIRSMHYVIDQQGCILNGTVVDREGALRLLGKLWEDHKLPKKGVHLLLDSNQITTKVTDVPMQKPKQMLQFVSREFSDVERMEDPLYAYFPLKNQKDAKVKMQTVFASMSPKKYLLEFAELFAELGIKLEGIEGARGSVLRLAEKMPQIQGNTCIVQFVDDITLINVLMFEGLYMYSNRSRLFADPGTPGFSVEVARAVSNIRQFAQTQGIQEPVRKVFISGMSDEDFDIYDDSLLQIDSQIQVEKLEQGEKIRYESTDAGEEKLTNYMIAVSGLTPTDAKTNLIAQMGKNPEKELEKQKRRKRWMPIVILGTVLAAGSLILGGRFLTLSMKLKEIQEYNQNPRIVAACDEFDQKKLELSVLSTLCGNMLGLENQVKAYPMADSSAKRVVEKCANGLVNIQISGYSSQNGVLSFDTSAEDVELIHRFVDLLNQQKIFANVDYTGYSQSAEGMWNVRVNCTMADRQEEENETDTDINGER